MDTKEKERRQPARPAKNPQAPKRRPAPPKAEQSDEVYIPEKESREAHNRPARSTGTARRPAPGAPEKRRAPAKQAGRKKAPDGQYHPYQKANAVSKQKRKQNLSQSIRQFFSYRSPLAKLFYKEDPNVFGADPNEVRKAKRAAELDKKRKRERFQAPDAVYIQPVAFNSRRLLIQLMTTLAVVVALVLGMSIFFRVEDIRVDGNHVYTEWTIREASGIKEGDNLLTFSRTKACGQIIAKLPYAKSARIGIKLPNTVKIEIEEMAVVYAIQDDSGLWWLINSDGKVVEQSSINEAKKYTQVLGVTLYMPQQGEMGVAAEELPTDRDANGELIPLLVTGAQRFNSALRILQALEDNDIVGDAASVDVSQLQDIILWYGTKFQVNLGTIDQILYKITYMKNAILQMRDYQTGVLDVSFTTWPDMAGYTPFG